MVECNGSLYVGGNFTQDFAATTTFNHIAKFDGPSMTVSQLNWTNHVGIGFNNNVYALCANDNSNTYLYVGGSFTQGGTAYNLNRFGCVETVATDLYSIDNNIAGSTNGANDIVRTISCKGNRIFIGGQFLEVYASITASIQTTFTYPYACVWTSNDYQSLNATEFEQVGTTLNGAVLTSVKDPDSTQNYFHFGGQFTQPFNYIAYCEVATPANVFTYNNTFASPCYSILSYSIQSNPGFIFAKEGNTTGKLWLVRQNQQLSLTTPSGIMTGCYDNNVPIFTFFFGNSTTVTTFNPTLTTTIDIKR
jgi:hypothetical protein